MSGTDCGVLAGGCSVTDTVLLLRPEHAGAPFAASPQTYLRLRVPVCRWVRNPRLCLALQAPHSCRQPYPTPLPPSSEGHCHGIASPALPVPKLCHHSGLQAQGLAALLAMDSRPALPPLGKQRARALAGHGRATGAREGHGGSCNTTALLLTYTSLRSQGCSSTFLINARKA